MDGGSTALLIALLFAPASITLTIALLRSYRITIVFQRHDRPHDKDDD